MLGSFVRVITVTYYGHLAPRPGLKTPTIARRTIIRDAGPGDIVPGWHWALAWPEGQGGPCGTAPVESEHSAIRWTVAYLRDYALRFGGSKPEKGKPRGTVGRATWYAEPVCKT